MPVRAIATLLALALLLPGVPGAVGGAMAQPVDVAAANRDGFIAVTASAELQVDPRTVWAVISDYDHLAEFIPYMRSSKVVQRDGNKLQVDLAGELAFLFFAQPVEVRLEVVETPQRRIVAHAVRGNLRAMEGRYAVEPLPSGLVRLSYSGGLAPEFPVPPVIGTVVVRMVLEKQFRALVAEIVRRDSVAHGTAAK
ncbi:SRPBCC family protein [Variovorax sp. M-6]|uniref:SRPBCC family protein n=1 Tax=Variovorax sp. M-6 TaxID=3233041 RepID=UPI003F966DDB